MYKEEKEYDIAGEAKLMLPVLVMLLINLIILFVVAG